MSRPETKPQNTLQQDLFLLAKSGYQETGLDASDAARMICCYHIDGFREYHYNLTHGLIDTLRTTQVRDGDKNLMPFELPVEDPVLLELLTSEGKRDGYHSPK